MDLQANRCLSNFVVLHPHDHPAARVHGPKGPGPKRPHIRRGSLGNNVSGHCKRSVAAAMQVGFGNCGGIVASNVYLQSELPLYRTGYG